MNTHTHTHSSIYTDDQKKKNQTKKKGVKDGIPVSNTQSAHRLTAGYCIQRSGPTGVGCGRIGGRHKTFIGKGRNGGRRCGPALRRACAVEAGGAMDVVRKGVVGS